MKVELRKCIHCGKECDPELEVLVYDLRSEEHTSELQSH